MRKNKKLQVFVSSTYTDLKAERQAAVEAILTAGHIPAGMELFTAGDESQMNVIKRWIDESDVYLLILGGRYGSLEPDSQKSYTHLEYEYALAQGKRLFAVVIKEDHLDEKIRLFGREVIETENPQKLRDFRQLVCSKMVRFWDDPRDIKLAILETLDDFSRSEDLSGWVPGTESANASVLAEEVARLVKENALLREQVKESVPVMATDIELYVQDALVSNHALLPLETRPENSILDLSMTLKNSADHPLEMTHLKISLYTAEYSLWVGEVEGPQSIILPDGRKLITFESTKTVFPGDWLCYKTRLQKEPNFLPWLQGPILRISTETDFVDIPVNFYEVEKKD